MAFLSYSVEYVLSHPILVLVYFSSHLWNNFELRYNAADWPSVESSMYSVFGIFHSWMAPRLLQICCFYLGCLYSSAKAFENPMYHEQTRESIVFYLLLSRFSMDHFLFIVLLECFWIVLERLPKCTRVLPWVLPKVLGIYIYY